MLLGVLPLRFVSGYQVWIAPVGFSMILIHGGLTAVLAGALSLGEERTLGLHAWNMTQPVSVRRQWAIKLITAVLASLVSSGGVVLAARLLFGPDFLQQF